jgi:hypothetical protein
VARVASWFGVLARDLSPAAAQAPRALRPAWSRRVVLCALVVLGLGTLDLYQHYRLSPGAAAALSVARALPLWCACRARWRGGGWSWRRRR